MSPTAATALARLQENPFYVLGLPPTCSRQEVEREGQKLLAMLELGLAEAGHYPTPLGPRPRTAEAVRAAMAELRQPSRRLLHELWARLPPDLTPGSAGAPGPAAEPWKEALVRLGWGAR
jgi:hypothetical protein